MLYLCDDLLREVSSYIGIKETWSLSLTCRELYKTLNKNIPIISNENKKLLEKIRLENAISNFYLFDLLGFEYKENAGGLTCCQLVRHKRDNIGSYWFCQYDWDKRISFWPVSCQIFIGDNFIIEIKEFTPDISKNFLKFTNGIIWEKKFFSGKNKKKNSNWYELPKKGCIWEIYIPYTTLIKGLEEYLEVKLITKLSLE